MAEIQFCSTEPGSEEQRTGQKNIDRLMELYHIGMNVKRSLLQYYLSQKNLNLADYLYGKYHCIPPDDVQRIIRTKHFQLSGLRVVTIDTLLSDHCYDLFWDSCLEKTGLESILETYKRDLYTLYIKGNRERNESSEKERKMGQLTKLQWELLYKGQMIDTSKVNDQLSTQFPTKGITVTSFDNDMNFVLLSNVCPLYKSLQIVTSNQLKISRIVVDHTVNIETFNKIWELMSTNLKPISRHCLCEGYYDQKLNSIMRSSFERLQSRENRKSILESTFENIIFSKDAEFINRVQKELELIEIEETKDMVKKLCDKEMPVVLEHGAYIAGIYPIAIAEATNKDLETCKSVCSQQTANLQSTSTSEKIDVSEEQRNIDRNSYLKLVCLIQDVARIVLVKVLKGRLPGADYGNAFNGMKNRLLPYLNGNQKQLIYPTCSKYTGDLSDMDISILYLILRNIGSICPHQNGWGKDPEEHDRSISANIERIRTAKNIIVSHSSNCSFKDEEFHNSWKTIRQCCVELGGEEYKERIDGLLTSTFSPDIELQLSEKLEYLKEQDIQHMRHCGKLEEVLDSIQQLMENRQTEHAFKGKIRKTKYEEGCTPLTLRIIGNIPLCKNEIKEKIENCNHEDMRVLSVEDGSIIIRLQMFSSAFQSFGYFLGVMDKLLQTIFPTRSVSGDTCNILISIHFEMHQLSNDSVAGGYKCISSSSGLQNVVPHTVASKPDFVSKTGEAVKHIKKVEKKLCSGSERKEIALNAVDVGSLENFLLPAPISVAILGQLLAIASTIDFSLENHVPIDGFKHVKQPGSFRACLVQISTSGCHAFTTAHTNMDKIRLYCMQFQGHVQNLVRIILKGSKQEKSTLAPIYLKDMMEKANKCLELAQKTESDFTGLTLLLSEVSMAAIAAKGLHESKLKEAMLQTQILEQRRERVQLQKREIEEEKLQVIEQLSVAKNAFDKIVDEIPGPMHTLGIATYEKTVNTLATGACIFGLSTLAAPVAMACVAAKGIVDIGKAFLGHKQKQKQGQSKEENKAAVKIALKNVPEIYALIRSLLANIESRLCQEKTIDDTKNSDEKQLQDDHQTKRDNDVNRINESFERYVKELDGSAFPNHEAVEMTRYLCKRSISVCVSLTQNQGCRVKIEDLFKEIKLCSDEAENLKIKSDLFFSAGSASCLNICVDSSNMDDKGMVQQANENVHTKIEIRKQNLEFMRRKQEAVKEKSQEINQQQCQLLEDLLKSDLQKVDFEEIIQTISQGMDALGRLEEQWHMMVAFFSYITNRIDVCISQDAQIFEQVLHGTGYTITAGTEDIILETAAGINSVAYSVGLIAQTYTDISGKHLVGASAGLIGMIALHPEKDADTLNERRRELNNKCANAQLEIKKLAAERREMALNHITEQFERIQILESELPVVEEDRKKKIQDAVAEGFEYVCNMERDESDYC